MVKKGPQKIIKKSLSGSDDGNKLLTMQYLVESKMSKTILFMMFANCAIFIIVRFISGSVAVYFFIVYLYFFLI
jgi:hypothetical protein